MHPVTPPRLSVLVRSYNRLAALCELVEVLLAQDHDSFEIVVVEQSTERPDAAVRRLAALTADRRLRVIRSKPLGGARARNLAVAHALGDIVVCIDDDDLPVGRGFLRAVEAPFQADPNCLGLTCRHMWGDREDIKPAYRALAARGCMRFSPVLKLPRTYPRYDEPVARVDYVHGSGGAYRRSVFDRFGVWDVDTPIEDETSLGIRIGRGLRAGEYLCFDPTPRLRRRLDLDGGLAKRGLTARRFYERFMRFVHAIMGRYYPRRVRLLYPAYAFFGLIWTFIWIWADSLSHRSFAQRLGGSFLFFLAWPLLALLALRLPFGDQRRMPKLRVRRRYAVSSGFSTPASRPTITNAIE
jgi:glycosyltransferase involved in cell wall biosynthesis